MTDDDGLTVGIPVGASFLTKEWDGPIVLTRFYVNGVLQEIDPPLRAKAGQQIRARVVDVADLTAGGTPVVQLELVPRRDILAARVRQARHRVHVRLLRAAGREPAWLWPGQRTPRWRLLAGYRRPR